MMGNGLTINNKVMAQKNGQMVHIMLEIIKTEKKMDMEKLFSLIYLILKEILLIIKFRDMVFIDGLMGENIKVIGKATKCMEMDNLFC